MAWITCQCGTHNGCEERDKLLGWTCGNCGLFHGGTARHYTDYPCLAVQHGCGSECTCPHQFLPGCKRCQVVQENAMKEMTMH
jgi:hypothetical protein